MISRSFIPILNALNSSCQDDALTSKILSCSDDLIFSIDFLKVTLISSRILTISGPLDPPNYGIYESDPFLAN